MSYSNKKIGISGSNYNTLFIRSDGTVYGCGKNNYHQLGISNTSNQIDIVKVPINNVVNAIISGAGTSLFLKSDGTVWGCGINNRGQLGTGNTSTVETIIKLDIDDVVSIDADGNHSLFLKSDGTVYGCGWNYYCTLGFGSMQSNVNNSQKTIVKLPISDVIDITVSQNSSIFLKSDGTVYGCGENSTHVFGQSGHLAEIQKLPITDVIKVACSNHILFLKSDGTVWGRGLNASCQLGNRDNFNNSNPYQYNHIKMSITDVIDIAVGAEFSLFLKSDGTVYGCGKGHDGALGYNANGYVESITKLPITDVIGIATGYEHSLFLKSDSNM